MTSASDDGLGLRLAGGVHAAYQLMLAYSSLRAVVKYNQGNFAWEKTSHVGAHLDTPRLSEETT